MLRPLAGIFLCFACLACSDSAGTGLTQDWLRSDFEDSCGTSAADGIRFQPDGNYLILDLQSGEYCVPDYKAEARGTYEILDGQITLSTADKQYVGTVDWSDRALNIQIDEAKPPTPFNEFVAAGWKDDLASCATGLQLDCIWW